MIILYYSFYFIFLYFTCLTFINKSYSKEQNNPLPFNSTIEKEKNINNKNYHINIVLNHPSKIKRRFSTNYLKFFNSNDHQILNTLLEALEDYDIIVQEIAIRAIASLKIPKKDMKKVSLKLMVFLKQKKSIKIKKLAIQTLGKIKSNYAFYPIIDQLNDPNILIQKSAILALTNIKNNKALRFIIPKLFHKNSEIRFHTALWIERFKDKRIIKFLKKVHNDDPNIKVRQVAAISLRKFGIDKELPR